MLKSLWPLLALLCPLSATAADEFALIAIEDGDTLVVDMSGAEVRVQLLGIDAPEDLVNPKLSRDLQRTGLDKETLITLGRQATAHLQRLVKPGQALRLEGDLGKQDRYGRTSAVVYGAESRSLNQGMIEDGYAIMIDRPPLPAALKAALQYAEKEATSKQSGLWKSSPKIFNTWSGRSR